MSYAVTIEYTGVETDAERIGAQIAAIYCPNNSYIESPVYEEGYPVDAEEADKTYGKSVYATHVYGNGEIDVPEPYATTSIPFPTALAQFKLAVVGEDNKVSFTVDSFAEAAYYMDLGQQMAGQGFTVTVDDGEDSGDGGDGDPD